MVTKIDIENFENLHCTKNRVYEIKYMCFPVLFIICILIEKKLFLLCILLFVIPMVCVFCSLYSIPMINFMIYL